MVEKEVYPEPIIIEVPLEINIEKEVVKEVIK